jgi:peptidoglycan biosynthesis protein MviN/MurJ (putative lipid II flippase)
VLDRWLASFGAPGDISLLHLLQQVFAGAAALFGKAVTEPLIGSLATNRKGGASVVKRLGAYRKIACTIAWLAIAGYAAGLGAAVLFGKSLVGMEAAHRLMPFVVAFGGLYTAGFLGQLAAAWFYANGDTRTPARVGAIGFSLGIAVRLALFPFTGALAIAVAISANQVVNWLMLRRAIRTTWAGHDVPVS